MAGSICTSCGKHVADTYTGVCRACLIDHYDNALTAARAALAAWEGRG